MSTLYQLTRHDADKVLHKRVCGVFEITNVCTGTFYMIVDNVLVQASLSRVSVTSGRFYRSRVVVDVQGVISLNRYIDWDRAKTID